MFRIEVYFNEEKIKQYDLKRIDRNTLDAIVKFIVNAKESLSPTNGIVIVNNKVVNDSGELEKIVMEHLKHNKKVKIKIQNIIDAMEVKNLAMDKVLNTIDYMSMRHIF